MSLDHDRWEKLLAAPEPHIDDGGFTARVMAALPRRRALALRRALVADSLLVAALVSVLLPPFNAAFAMLGTALASLGSLLAAPDTTIALAGVPSLLAAGVLLVLLTWGGIALAKSGEL